MSTRCRVSLLWFLSFFFYLSLWIVGVLKQFLKKDVCSWLKIKTSLKKKINELPRLTRFNFPFWLQDPSSGISNVFPVKTQVGPLPECVQLNVTVVVTFAPQKGPVNYNLSPSADGYTHAFTQSPVPFSPFQKYSPSGMTFFMHKLSSTNNFF